jgi:hypothetical protein
MATDKFMEEAFLLESESLMEKADLLTTNPENWRTVYHSSLDTREKAEDIDEALEFLRNYFEDRSLIK